MLNIDHFKLVTDELSFIRAESSSVEMGSCLPRAYKMRLHFLGFQSKESLVCEDYNEEILHLCRSIASSPICQDGNYRVLCYHHRNENNYFLVFTQDELSNLCELARIDCIRNENHNYSLRSRQITNHNSMNSDYY
jgi:hypothetical protein